MQLDAFIGPIQAAEAVPKMTAAGSQPIGRKQPMDRAEKEAGGSRPFIDTLRAVEKQPVQNDPARSNSGPDSDEEAPQRTSARDDTRRIAPLQGEEAGVLTDDVEMAVDESTAVTMAENGPSAGSLPPYGTGTEAGQDQRLTANAEADEVLAVDMAAGAVKPAGESIGTHAAENGPMPNPQAGADTDASTGQMTHGALSPKDAQPASGINAKSAGTMPESSNSAENQQSHLQAAAAAEAGGSNSNPERVVLNGMQPGTPDDSAKTIPQTDVPPDRIATYTGRASSADGNVVDRNAPEGSAAIQTAQSGSQTAETTSLPPQSAREGDAGLEPTARPVLMAAAAADQDMGQANAGLNENGSQSQFRQPGSGPVADTLFHIGDDGLNSERSAETGKPNSGDIMQQVIKKAALTLRDGRSEVRIELKPEILGQVRMQITTDHHQVSIRIAAESASVKEILETHLHQLKTELSSQGVAVEELEVSVADDSGRQREHVRRFGVLKAGSNRRDDASTDPADQTTEVSARPSIQESAGFGAVDYFA